jgi:hypothetical protein
MQINEGARSQPTITIGIISCRIVIHNFLARLLQADPWLGVVVSVPLHSWT